MVEPSIVHRGEQPYVGVTATIAMDQFAVIGDRIGELVGWVTARGVGPTGPPFFRYHVIDMPDRLVVTAGVPVAAPVPGDGDIEPGVLPAGEYAHVVHHGSPDRLEAATAQLLDWASDRDLRWDSHPTEAGQAWGSRLEIFRSDPREVDPDDWVTELAFKLA